MTGAATEVRVELGARSYSVQVGARLLPQLGEILLPLALNHVFALTDTTVDALHGEALREALAASGIRHTVHAVAPGEASKSFGTLQEVLDAMFKAGLSRSDTVLAFGGGVVGDLAGFASAVFKRGTRFVQVPTTLLAQVDSSVGGKTAINVAQGKNLVGAFHQPERVVIDTDVLDTLPERELKAGYAEVLKVALIGDAHFFRWLEANGESLLARDPDALAYAIATSVGFKARVVEADETERGRRALLNLGHTFAHALEQVAGYDGSLLHGEAVGVGLALAFEFSHRAGLCAAEDAARVAEHLRDLDLVRPHQVGHLLADPDALVSAMRQDKKNQGGALTLILARGIGEAFVERGADAGALGDYLHYLAARHATKPDSLPQDAT